jgi:hypothetical protein
MKKMILNVVIIFSYYGCITVNLKAPTAINNKVPIDSFPKVHLKTESNSTNYSGTSSERSPLFDGAEFNQPLTDFDPITLIDADINSFAKKNESILDRSVRLKKTDTTTPPYRRQKYEVIPMNKKIPFVYSYKQAIKGNKEKNKNSDCQTTYLNFNCSSTSFMNADYENQGQYIYPSAIYDVEDFQNGRFIEVTKGRKSITLSTDNPNLKNNSFISVPNPHLITLREGIKELYTNFDETRSGNMDFRYQIYTSYNSVEHQLKLSTGGGGSFGPFSANMEATLNTNDKTSHTYVTVDIIKDLYTINSLPNNNSYFDTGIAKDNKGLMVINSVTYGLRILANIDITAHEEEVQTIINTSAGFSFVFSAHGHIDLNKLEKIVHEEAKVNCYVIGGPINSTCSFTLKDFEEQIKNIVGGATYNNARPIQYTLSDLQGNVIAIKSSVTDIAQSACGMKRPDFVYVDVITGSKDKGNEADITFALYKGDVPIANLIKITNAACFEMIDPSDLSGLQNAADARGLFEAGNLIGAGSSCYESILNDNSPSTHIIHILSKNSLESGGTLLIKHNQKGGGWNINAITLYIKLQNEGSFRKIVWKLPNRTLFERGVIKLRFDDNFHIIP